MSQPWLRVKRVDDRPVLPDYDGACIAGVVPAVLAAPGSRPAWLPGPVLEATQVVVLVLDGLGWLQLRARAEVAPNLSAMAGGAITSVVPTTTATALASIVSGSAPAVHGMVGYRMRVDVGDSGAVLNALRWTTPAGDAREAVPPERFLAGAAFAGRDVPVVSGAAFEASGFSVAHLGPARMASWHMPSGIAVQVRRWLSAGSPLVYAYYEGIDKVAHGCGFGELYDAELAAADRLVGEIASSLPPGAALVVTADHGQVEVGERVEVIGADLLERVQMLSGEARFVWFHARPGAAGEVAEAAEERYGDRAWVRSVDQLDEERWFGGPLDHRTRARLGDVAVVARAPVGLLEPGRSGEHPLVCRHGSLTAEEMLVPLLALRS